MELQFILGKGSSLIAEEVLYLPQFLVQRCSAGKGLAAAPTAEHQLIEIYEVTLSSLDDFNADDERDRNEGAVLYEEEEEVHDEEFALRVGAPQQIVLALTHRHLFRGRKGRNHKASCNLADQ